MTAESALVINVQITKEDDIYYASSADLPGLHVCGYSEDQTCNSVIKAVAELLRRNRGMNVRVIPATNNLEEFQSAQRCYSQFVALHA